MDINFGSNTNRHNFHFGEDQVTAIDLGNTRVWTNEVTLTLTFVDNTGAGANLNSDAPIVLTGVPGAAFTTQTRSVAAASSAFVLNSVSCAENGDTVTCTTSGGTITISGTFPSSTVSVPLTITANTTALTVSTCSATRSGNTYTVRYSGNATRCTWSSNGGGTDIPGYAGFVTSATSGTLGIAPHTSQGGNVNSFTASTGGPSFSLSFSWPATATHTACSA